MRLGSLMGNQGENMMKLNLIFMIMDMLILLAYPIVFVYSKLRQLSKIKATIDLAN